jgi:hypothetical protein
MANLVSVYPNPEPGWKNNQKNYRSYVDYEDYNRISCGFSYFIPQLAGPEIAKKRQRERDNQTGCR